MSAVLIALVGMIFVRRSATELKVSEKKSFPEWRVHTLRTTMKSVPGLFMPVIILGGIYSGVMTVTESAAVAAVYAMVIAVFVYRDILLRDINKILSESGVTSGVIMFSIFFIVPFSRLLLQEGLPQIILDFLFSISDEKWAILIMINFFMITLGMVMDDICGALMVATILTPVMRGIGVSPYNFAAIVGVNLGFGLITPPCAPFLFVTSRITGVPVTDMFKYVVLIILLAYLPVLIITTYVPSVSLWIPQMVLGDKFSAF